MAAASALNTESRVHVFVLCHNVNTNQKNIAFESALNLTSLEVASDEVDFRAVSIAIFLGFFSLCNVATYMQTQLEQKFLELVFETEWLPFTAYLCFFHIAHIRRGRVTFEGTLSLRMPPELLVTFWRTAVVIAHTAQMWKNLKWTAKLWRKCPH